MHVIARHSRIQTAQRRYHVKNSKPDTANVSARLSAPQISPSKSIDPRLISNGVQLFFGFSAEGMGIGIGLRGAGFGLGAADAEAGNSPLVAFAAASAAHLAY